MDVVTKSVDAQVNPVESDFPGEFEVILSTETLDRDAENLWAEEWKQPLPARIHIDGDHGRTLEKTVGSAVPSIEGNRMIGKGTYAGTQYAQMVRQLVNEGHINSVSVTYAESKNQKNDGVQRELLNAAFVAVPANPEAIVLASKSAQGFSTPNETKAEGGMDASGNNPDVKHDDMVQAIHDAAAHLGAQCMNAADADPGTADGANKSIDKEASASKEVGSPRESAEESAAAEPAAKAAGSAAAEESADDVVARQKAKQLELGRGTAFLIKMNTLRG
jgi:hypothetical protein